MSQHVCEHICIRCMDFRIQETCHKLLEELNIQHGKYDLVTVAGGAGAFDFTKHHLELSKRLHQSSQAILLVHEDCGAGAKKEDLHQAAKIAKELGFDSRAFYIKLDGTWEEIITV